MKNTPLFSIVIVNYNHGEFLDDTIKSILSQSCSDFELIIIDGGSTDNSVQTIKKYENRLAWWVTEKDNGQSDAFNKGFSKAKGDFFFWVNADDILLPNSIKFAKEYVMKYPGEKWFAANTIFLNKDGIIQKCARGLKWYNFLIKNAVIYVYGPTSIFHRSLFSEVGGFDESLHYTMDSDLWMRFMNKGVSFIRIPRYFWAFRLHENSKTSHSFFNKPSIPFRKEQKLISKKNNVIRTKIGIRRQWLFKFLFGSYFLSFLDTCKYRGKTLSTLKIDE